MSKIVYFLILTYFGQLTLTIDLKLPDGSTFALNSSLKAQTFTLSMESDGKMSSKF